MRIRGRRLACAAVLAAFAALVSGCSLLGIPDPAASPLHTSTPTPSPAFALDCATLVGSPDLTTLLGAGATAAPEAPGSALLVAAAGPLAVRAAGGATCGWRQGDASLDVELLPHASDSWAKLAGLYPQAATPGADYQGGVSLGGDCALQAAAASAACHTNVLVDGAWLAVSLKTVSNPGLTEAGFHDSVQRMIPAVVTAVSTAPAARSGTAVDCAADELRAEVQHAFARPTAAVTQSGQTFGIGSAVALTAGAALCEFTVGEEDGSAYLGSLSILPDGADLFDVYRQEVLVQDPTAHSDEITVGGSAVPALVWGGEIEGVPFSSVDVRMGATWIQFHSTDQDSDHSLALIKWVAGRL